MVSVPVNYHWRVFLRLSNFRESSTLQDTTLLLKHDSTGNTDRGGSIYHMEKGGGQGKEETPWGKSCLYLSLEEYTS